MVLNFNNPKIQANMFNGTFGLEKESLRIDKDGYLSHTKHPFDNSPNIERDFCENQVEIVTDVCKNTDELYEEIKKLHKSVVNKIISLDSGEEYLWPFSNPPYVKGENDIPIADFRGDLQSKSNYRQYLAEKYGKRKMLFCGIHYNYSLPDAVIEEGFKESGYNSLQEYKNTLYLELAKKITEHSWLIVYLTAASPVMDGSLFKDDAIGKTINSKYASARCSEIGYWNNFVPVLDYDNIDNYISSILKYIDQGLLRTISELYYPVRLKPKGENSLKSLAKNGVNHIELRMLDLNPLSPIGVIKEDIDFIHYLILYLLSTNATKFGSDEQTDAIQNSKKSAEFDDNNIFISSKGKATPIKVKALEILEQMEKFYSDEQEVSETIKYQKDKILTPQKRYAVIINNSYKDKYVEKGLLLAKKYSE
jgi:glutamate--cysteine ligase